MSIARESDAAAEAASSKHRELDAVLNESKKLQVLRSFTLSPLFVLLLLGPATSC
jgi:hypothetical protein